MHPLVSVLIPCYFSEKNIRTVLAELQTVFSDLPYRYEIICVNDGSTDQTVSIIKEMAKVDPRIVLLNLSKNYGRLSAITAGHAAVRGDYLIYMDDDGQHPADQIPALIQKLDEGYDVVYAHFKQKHQTGFRNFVSWLHNRFLVKTIGKPKSLAISSFYAVNRMMIQALKTYDKPFASQLGFMLQITNRFANIPMTHRPRLEGKSGYTLKKLIKQWATICTNFSTFAVHLALKASFLGLILTLISGGVALYQSLTGMPTSWFMWTWCIILSVFSSLAFLIGICGDYLARIYMMQSGKPAYYVRESVDYRSHEGDHIDAKNV